MDKLSNNITNELEKTVQKLKQELSESKATVEGWQEMFKEKYLPLLKFVNELGEMPEFEDLKRRMYEKKEERLQDQVREG